MSLENFNGNDHGVLQQIVINHPIENIDCSIVTTGSKQWISWWKLNVSDGLVVIFQTLVWLWTHINIKPHNFPIICSKNKIVTARMYRYTWDPFATRLILCDDRLFLQIVLENMHVCASKEVRLCWMERYRLNNTLWLSKWTSWICSAQAVDHDLTWCLNVVSQRGKIVSFAVPNDFTYDVFHDKLDWLFSIRVIWEFPFHEFLFSLTTCFDINLVLSFPWFHWILGLLGELFAVKTRLENVNILFVSCSQHTVYLAWTPFHAINNLVLKLILPKNSWWINIPNNQVVILISRRKVPTIRRYGYRSHAWTMEFEINWNSYWKWLQIIWRWQFRNQWVWICNLCLLACQSWTHVQV